jgi:hypothetical protein
MDKEGCVDNGKVYSSDRGQQDGGFNVRRPLSYAFVGPSPKSMTRGKVTVTTAATSGMALATAKLFVEERRVCVHHRPTEEQTG